MNIIAFFHAYKLTHFADENSVKTKSSNQLSTSEKVKTILFGVNNPKPINTSFPSQKFEKVFLRSNKEIECWSIKKGNSKGTVVLFHGYNGNKSSMLDKSDEFLKLGYSTFLVDFMGSGNSEGNQTTIGFKEAEEVKTVFDYLKKNTSEDLFLFGTSMGAVAIMKAENDYQLNPKGIILECPFGTMYQTTAKRFSNMNVPAFPMAGLLLFWGGTQNGFWAFGHEPIEYAKKITCPTLLLYGEKDNRVSREEIDMIYENLLGEKDLKTYPKAGHENYLKKYKEEWTTDVGNFLGRN
ncbi:alpha/beta hydrolase [Flavobacterium qiangtangense]|uniref:Alpha/beta hydrolase n=1 Tax=Flavobacterium qiangtangense TaxID=1442595 RepID=A0ABW1PT17_9FLAO